MKFDPNNTTIQEADVYEDVHHYWTTGSGRIELDIAPYDARYGSHQGRCNADIESLSALPYIRDQLDRIDRQLLINELSEYGAWESHELQDHEMNLQRILWLACGDIVEELNQ